MHCFNGISCTKERIWLQFFFSKDDLRKEWPCESEVSIFVSIHMTQTLAFFVFLVEMNEIAPNNTKPKLLCSHC